MYSLLYVDDEPSLLELAKIFLERTDSFSVTTKISAKEGLDILKNGTFDAVISDYAMAGMDGIEFLKKVRAEYPALPFLLFTGKGREEIAMAGSLLGSLLLIPRYGVLGAAYGVLCGQVVFAVSTAWLAQMSYPIPYESARLVKAAVAAVLLFGLVVILRTGAPVTDLFTAVAVTLSYPAILWAWRFLNPAEMASVRHVARLLTGKVTGAPKVRQ